MLSRLRSWRASPKPVVIFVLTVIYFLAGKLGLSLAFVHTNSSPVWPPTGIALAAFLVLGQRVWPAIFIGAFLVNVTTAGSIATSLGVALGNTLEAAVAAYLITRLAGGLKVFDRSINIFLFALFAGLVGPIISATIGVISLTMGGYAAWHNFGPIWSTWWLGDMGGALLVTPALILWIHRPALSKKIQLTEFFLLLVLLVSVGLWLFGGLLAIPVRTYPLSFLPLPILIWIAFRFSQRETAFATLIISSLAVLGTLRGFGPFAGLPVNESLLFLQIFMAVISITTLLLASAVGERRRLQNYYQALIEHSYDAVTLIDSSGNFLWFSPSSPRVLGYSTTELIGRNAFELIHPQDVEYTKSKLGELVHTSGNLVSAEYRFLHKDASWRWIEAVGANLLSDPNVAAVVVNYRDITDRKVADQVRTEFVSLASHQLRTPLSALRWYTERLLIPASTASLSPQHKKYLRLIMDTTLQMTDMVTSLLSLSRLHLGTFVPVSQSFRPSLIINKLLKDFRPQFISKKITVKKSFPKSLPELRNDPQLFQSIVHNLLSNALKFTPSKGRLTLSLFVQNSDLVLSISDSGPGISEDLQPFLFTNLFRPTNIKQSESSGTGLGLYLTKIMVDHCHGRVWYTTSKDQGSTFFVSLPLS